MVYVPRRNLYSCAKCPLKGNNTFSKFILRTKIRKHPLTERLHTATKIKSETDIVLLCTVCYKEIMNMLFIPYGYIITCIQCFK